MLPSARSGDVVGLIRSVVPVALTSLVGRSVLIDEARRLLDVARVVTLTGPGGVGKTRVAWELAHLAGSECDIVAVADLLELSGAQEIEQALVSTLGIARPSHRHPRELLIESLAGKQVMLVLDNCEYLWEAVGDVVTALCTQLPGLRVLATSRRPLEVSGEHVLQVPPLPVPSPGCLRQEAAVSDAVILLGERAAAAGRPITGFIGEHWAALIQLVRWSGGLPLVLELIALRLAGGLSPSTIMQRLDGGRLLESTGRRVQSHHRALRRVLDWSYGLCSPGEQRLWARLSVFNGGFDLAMAEEVCGDPDGVVAESAVIDLLAGLVQQSIVVAQPDGRFRQLPPVHAYGQRRLLALGQQEATRERHVALIGRLAADADRQRCSPGELDIFRRVHRELPNIRAALTYCATPQRAATGLRIANDISQLSFSFLAAFDEFSPWLERLLVLTAAEPSPDRVTALAMLALIRLWKGDMHRADAHRRACLDEHSRRQPSTQDNLPLIMFLDGMYLFLADSDTRCISLLAQARDAFDGRHAEADAFRARAWLAMAAGFFADQDTARRAADDCLTFAETHGGSWSRSWGVWSQGRAARTDPRTAIPLLQQALRMMVDTGDEVWGAAICVEAIAWVWAAHGQARPAACLLGAVVGVQQNTGVAVSGPGPFHREREHAIAHSRAALGEQAHIAAFHQGTELSIDEAYNLALSNPTPDRETPRHPRRPLDTLTTRQHHIGRLVAQGLSNAQISQRLHISQRTVENHLGQIFTRLGVHNRAQVAALITANTLLADTEI